MPSAGIMGRTATAQPTARADGQLNAAMMGTRGEIITKEGGPSALDVQGTVFVSATGNSTMVAAAGPGLRTYITGIQFTGGGTTGTNPAINIQDGVGGTVIWGIFIPSTTFTVPVVLRTPLRSSVNTVLNLNFASNTGGGVTVNYQGYVAP